MDPVTVMSDERNPAFPNEPVKVPSNMVPSVARLGVALRTVTDPMPLTGSELVV